LELDLLGVSEIHRPVLGNIKLGDTKAVGNDTEKNERSFDTLEVKEDLLVKRS